ncbi:MAG TPA: carboxypeptidase-like regulatory domain-containing protein [Thermoanaerobaculia bacterium]|nr:carboxypeptidase-like regulatory domain-containing protein [Thermoanaerobaculia bacterium]
MTMHRLAIALSLLFTLTAAASNDLRGVVVDDASAKPVAGAHVYVYTASPKIGLSAFCPSCYRDCGKKEQVDSTGTFRIEALDPTLFFNLLAVADGYEPVFANKVDPASGSVTIRMTPRSTADADRLVTGTVHDPEGKPVVGAIVEPNGYTIEQKVGSRTSRRTGYGEIPGLDKLSVTNAKGEFALRMPAAGGKLDVRVTARALAPRIERTLVAGEPRKIALMPGATISGRVLRDGQPAAGIPVKFQQQSRAAANFLGRFEIATNDDGLFVMTNLGPNETYVVSAAVDGGVVEPKIVKTGADETSADAGVLPVERGRRIAGTIVPPEGMPTPPKTQVLLVWSQTGTSATTEAAPDGRFVFEAVQDGSATLYAPLRGLTVSPRSAWFDLNEEAIIIPGEGDCLDLRVLLAEE